MKLSISTSKIILYSSTCVRYGLIISIMGQITSIFMFPVSFSLEMSHSLCKKYFMTHLSLGNGTRCRNYIVMKYVVNELSNFN